MRNTQTPNQLLRLMRNVFLFDIVLFGAVGLIYLLAGWHTIHQYGNGLIWAGVIGFLLALVSVGWRNNRREDNVSLAQVMPEHEVFFQLNRDLGPRANALLVGVIALVIIFATGLVLTAIF